MVSIAQPETQEITILLHHITDAMRERGAFALSCSADVSDVECATFARLDAEVNAQLEACATQLALHVDVMVF